MPLCREKSASRVIFEYTSRIFFKQGRKAIFSPKITGGVSPERRAVDAVSDSIGSIACSHTYGYGHPDYTGREGRQMQQAFGSRDYYKVQNTHGLAYGEAIANVKALRGTVPDDILKGMFPKIFEIVVKLEGK